MDETRGSFDSGRLIFILGIGMRSGTNYLRDLLMLHPDCGFSTFHEDHILHYSSELTEFVTLLSGRWGMKNKGNSKMLWDALGDGLGRMIAKDAPDSSRIVTKTPGTRGIERTPLLFPKAKLVIIVRDGRDLVESGVRSFPQIPFDKFCEMFEQSARRVSEFCKTAPEWFSWKLVRYEDIFGKGGTEIPALLDFLKLDLAKYPLDAGVNLPVRGSSTFGRDGDVVWTKTHDKTPEFQPIGRWKDWSGDQRKTFDRIVGDAAQPFGYGRAMT